MVAALRIPPTPLANAFRHIEPTWRTYVYYADLAAKGGDEPMKSFMASYNALPPSEQRTIMPDRVCDLAGVAPGELIASVSRELWNHMQGESTITASINHPKVIERTAYFARQYEGHQDRELFLRATGTLPDKKGASIVINNTPQNANVNLPSPAALSGFRPMDQSVIDMSKLLDEPAEEPLAVPVPREDRELVFQETD